MSAGRQIREFASDNHAGAHPEVLEAIAAANSGHTTSYGDDHHTAAAAELFRSHFGEQARPFFVFNGTAANVLSIDAITETHEAVICTETAHLHVDECGAPERIAGVKLLPVAPRDGKLDPGQIAAWDARRGDEHQSQPRVVSIAEATELGMLYTPEEIAALAAAAHEREMFLHVDGARLANAAAALGLPLRALTTDVGVDVLSFGGTKNGLLFGEAVVFLRPELAEGFRFRRKQGMQLASKMRFLAAQFQALLEGELWRESAAHANAMAAKLAAAVEGFEGLEIVYPVEANAVFAKLPRPAIDRLLEAWPADHPFYIWDDAESVVRWMCAWDTEEADVEAFAAAVGAALRG